MGSISCGGVGVWSVTHRQRVRSRDDTQVGSRAEERPESQENLYKKKKGYIYMASSQRLEGMGKMGEQSARGQGQLMQTPEGSGRPRKTTLRHVHSILQAWGGIQRQKRGQICIFE